jgi:tetratricopeptide (TPR) repeat protein
MDGSAPVPGIAQELATLLDRFEGREVLRRLDDPHDGGALSPAIGGILRARALASVERFHEAYKLLGEVRAMRDLGERERIEAQILTARVLRFASPLVDYALELSLAAADAGSRAGTMFATLRVDAHVEAALLFLRKRCRKLAERELALADGIGVHPERVHAARAELALIFDERTAAKTAFDAAVALGGDGARRGHLGLARLYTILGEFPRAAQHLQALGSRPAGDIAAKRVRYRLHAAQGQWLEVAAALESILESVPDADGAPSMRLERASAFYKGGDVEKARQAWAAVAESTKEDDAWAARAAARTLAKLEKADAKRTRLVAFPSVAQLRNHCGPASVELCLRFFGVTSDQVEVAREIKHPDGGTPVHRMRAYMERAGFLARRIEADLPKLKAILDAGIPVIIEEDYSTTRHVAVAVGYDDRREILEVQDPMTHEIRETPYEEYDKLREFSNHGALVSVPRNRDDLIAKLDACGALECAYISKTDLAWEAHDRKAWDEGDKFCDEAVALHEPYELAWVYRFVRARDTFLENRTDENKEALGNVLNRLLELWPNDEWPQQFLGRVYSIEERWGDALAAFERARDRDPDDANNWCSIGDTQLELGNKEEARKAFEEALKRDPAHVRANENRANASFEAGDLSLAMILNQCALELNPDNAFNYHVNGRILGRKGNARGAAAAYARALERVPGSQYFSVERARYLAKAGSVADALTSLRKLVDADEKDTYVAVQLADLAYEHGEFDVCIETCKLIETRDAKTATPKAIGGAARCKRGDLEGGVPLLREAIKIRPTYAWAYREMGRAFTRAGRHDEALTACAAAVGLGGGTLATFHLAEALAHAGHNEDALNYYRRAANNGDLGEAELDRVAAAFREIEGAGSAHHFFGHLAEHFPRDPAILRAHARLLLETMWYPGTAAPVLSKLSELSPDDPFVLAKAGDDFMDQSIDAEVRGEELLRRAIAAEPKYVSARRLLALQLNARGRFADTLKVLEPCPADDETMEARVRAHIGLRKEADGRAAIDAYGASMPEEQRGKARRPLEYAIAKAGRKWSAALSLAEALSEDEGELPDDGELGRWEEERFSCLVALGRGEEAYTFGAAQCADAEDRGRLAYDALVYDDHVLAEKLAREALAEDEDEVHALHIMARLAEHRGDVAEATRIWERMRDISTWHIHVENLGRLALATGDLTRARTFLEESVASGHICPVSLELRAELRLLEGDREGAKADADRAAACLQLELRDVSEQLDGLRAGLAGDREAARALYDRYLKREKLTKQDLARYAKVREALKAA